ncbi:MerR family transcriptional regulator [Goodfellowiella coeruleoviolacea]|uniref:MerR family transcriptional regulator n=1 Tax=Goodfellowiella coeruleoviolacea TaxID=334858 RepID=UPI0020A57F3A|nr:GyrI-like domain-containing protein [Goodfellowiella coeruleoviolacea]
MTEALMPIGRFGRLCRLSVKQLRHYDDLGLLRPAWVDPHTGYRYYRADQTRDALSIGLLRSLDVPLPAIGRVLAGVDVAAVLGEVRDRMEAELARRRRALSTLDRVLTSGLPTAEVRLVREEPRRVAVSRDAGATTDISTLTSGCVSRLVAALTAAGQPPTGPLVGLFPLDLGEQVAVTVAAPAAEDVPGLPGDVLAGGVFATATHVGPYDQSALTTHALLAWLGEHGHTPVGELREVYVSDPRQSAPDELVTQVMIRIEEAE